MKPTALLLVSLGLISFAFWSLTAQEQPVFKVITNPENPVTSLSKTDVSKMLLKKVSKWDNGDPVEAVDQAGSREIREVFTKEIHGRSLTAIKRYWQGKIFSGKGAPPLEVADDSEVIEFVSSRPGSIGYVSGDVPLEGVKVLLITE